MDLPLTTRIGACEFKHLLFSEKSKSDWFLTTYFLSNNGNVSAIYSIKDGIFGNTIFETKEWNKVLTFAEEHREELLQQLEKNKRG
jgi:exosome complex RNA-binding protein Rrp42 (RNase PH superfamily)